MTSHKAQEPADFGSLEEVTNKYIALRAAMAGCRLNCVSSTHVVPRANETQEGYIERAIRESAHELPDKTPPVTPPHAFKKTAVSPEEFSVEDIATLEKHRLSIWLAKFAVVLIALIVVVLLLCTMYFVISSNTMPDATLFGAIVTNLNDIVLAVLNAGKVP